MIHSVPCDACAGGDFRALFKKSSPTGEVFQIVKCSCGLVQVNPQPDVEHVRSYYEGEYFKKRTDRGYADYYSQEVKSEIRRVYELNLNDLGFIEFENEILDRAIAGGLPPSSLDAGCAAGYFVEYLKDRGWDAQGIDISEQAASFGRDSLGLDIRIGDFLSCEDLSPSSYDLITLWASLEHMHSPRKVLARAHELLRPGGRMILSTCRYGWIARIRGLRWRYMNVPEHLYYFSLGGLKKMARELGLETVRSITYGSGFTTKKNAGLLYRFLKIAADPLVKFTRQGDMMAMHLRRVQD